MVDSKKWLLYAIDHSKTSKEYRNFYLPMKNKNGTVKTYAYSLYRFMDYLTADNRIKNTESFTQLVKHNPKSITEYLKDWIFELSEGNDKRNKITSSAIRTMLAGVIAFFEANELEWNPRRILKSIPRDDRIPGGKVAATNDDVVSMLDSTNLISEKAIVHFIASTGIRPGAIGDPILCMKHLVKMPKSCYGVTVYDESKEGYWAFLTPEASKILDAYHEQRRQRGEILDTNSPIFRNKVRGVIIPLSASAARKVFYKLIGKGGVKRVKNGNRYDKAVITMYRKRFNGVLKMDNSVNSNIAEKLMAHKRGLDGTYLAPTRDECFAEFSKAIFKLTVDPTERQKLEIETKKEEIQELEKKQVVIEDQQKQLDEMKQRQEDFEKKWMEVSFPGIND